MKKFIGLFVFALVLSVGIASLSYAAGDMAAQANQTVNGDLLKIDGEFYVVKEMSGKEIRLHVDKTTILDSSINVGEKVEAQATEKTTQCPLDTYSPRSRFGDTKVEIRATEIGPALRAGPIRT